MNPQLMGLLAGAASGMEASGPSRTPVSMGQVLSRGLLGGMQAYQGAEDRNQRQGLLAAQLGQLKLQEEVQRENMKYQKQQREQALLLRRARAGIFGDPGVSPQDALAGGGGPTNANAGMIRPPNPMAINPQGAQRYLMAGGDPKVLESFQNLGPQGQLGKIDPKDYTPDSFAQFMAGGGPAALRPRSKIEVAPNGIAYDPFSTAAGTTFADPNKAFSIDANGQAVPNKAFQDFKIAESGARRPVTNVSVNTEKTLFGNVAEKVGDQIATGADQARSALGTISTVNQIRSAIDSGKVMAGPATNARMFLGQVGQVMGIAGKDATEQLTQTRKAIQGLANLELSAAQLMRGQGQITEAEREIIRRAASGDIERMTTPELTTLLNTLDKTARFKIQSNMSNVNRLSQNPNSRVLAPFMQVDEPPQYQPRPRQSTGAVLPGFRVLGAEGQ